MKNTKLGWVEFGRGCAALIVFIAHGFYADVPAQYGYTYLWGRWGVCFFFVLSGFIIAHVHWNDVGQPHRVLEFWRRRLIRIFPTYWLALTVFLILRNFIGNPDYHIASGEIVGNIVIWPTIHDLILPMAWTLRHELLFYGLFSLLIINADLGATVMAAWTALLVWILFHQTPCETLTIAAARCINSQPIEAVGSLIPTMNVNLYFLIGIGLAASLRFGLVGVVTFIAMTATIVSASFDLVFSSTYAVAISQVCVISFLVGAAIVLSQNFEAPPFALWFGSISYSFYLFHMPMMLAAHGLVKRIPFPVPWQVTMALALVLAIMASDLVARYFEAPIRSLRKSRPRPIAVSDKTSDRH